MRFAQVFGDKHLFGSGFLFVLVMVFLLWLKQDRQHLQTQQRRYLILFTSLFLGIEIIRLILLVIRDGGLAIYQLPLNLCSVPLYLYPILTIDNKQEMWKKWLMPSAFATVMLAGLVALLIPSNILGNSTSWFPLSENGVEIASFTYHAVMIAAPIALIKLGYYQPKIKDIPYAWMVTGGFAVIAMIVNSLTNQDFLLLNHGNGSPFQFLIATSRFLYQGVMITLGMVLISLFFIVGQWLTQPARSRKKQSASMVQQTSSN